MAKITDVAKLAGVAPSTVSNVLTGNKYVSDELRKKVLAACEQLDFHPNFFASGLSRNRTNIIALLLENNPDLYQNAFYKDLIAACLTQASKHGYSLLVYYNSDKNKLLDTLRQGMAPIDGAILMAPCINDERLQHIRNDCIKCVVIGRPDAGNLSYVDVDNCGLVEHAANEMLDLYDEVYLINSLHNMTISEDRRKGFENACAKHGVISDGHILESSTGSEEVGYWIARSIVGKNIGIITANGRTARGVYRAAEEKGLEIGKDIGVFALGRSQPNKPISPELSYATQDYTLLGETAVDLLIEEIESGVEHKTVLVKSGIVDGCSLRKEKI